MNVPPFIPSVKANPDSITYNAGVITVDGTYTDVFEDIYTADQAGGWDVFTKTGTDAYACNATQINFGDGENITVVSDSACLVNFFGDTGNAYVVKNNATVNFGILINSTEKTTKDGVAFVFEDYYYAGDRAGATSNYYGCSFVSDENIEIDFFGSGKVYHCSFTSGYYMIVVQQNADYDFYDVYASNDYEVLFETHESIEMNIIKLVESPYNLKIRDLPTDGVIKNLYCRRASIANILYHQKLASYANNTYLVNPDLDVWSIEWDCADYPIHLYRQYTYDLTIQFLNTTKTENANVTITNTILGTSDSWSTPANGSIPQQTYSYGHYNQTGGDTLYDYNPYNLTITYPDYQTYTALFDLTEKTDWTITLTPETTTEEETEDEGVSGAGHTEFLDMLIWVSPPITRRTTLLCLASFILGIAALKLYRNTKRTKFKVKKVITR